MNKNWIFCVLSSVSMLMAMTLLVVFVKNYTIPHGSTYTFTPSRCKVTGAFCLRPPNLDNQNYTVFNFNSNNSITPNKTYEHMESQTDDVEQRVSHLMHGARNDVLHGVSSSEHETRSSFGDKSTDKSVLPGINGILNISLGFPNIYQYDQHLNYVSKENGLENNMNITRSTMLSSFRDYLQQSINQSLNEKHKVLLKDIPPTYDTNTAGCVIVLIDIVDTTDYVETLPLIQDPWVYYSMVETDAGPQMQVRKTKIWSPLVVFLVKYYYVPDLEPIWESVSFLI